MDRVDIIEELDYARDEAHSQATNRFSSQVDAQCAVALAIIYLADVLRITAKIDEVK